MKAQANSAPVRMYLIERHPQKPGHVQVRFFENVRETDSEGGWEYDEYIVTVPKAPGLAEKIEGDFDTWLLSAKSASPEYSAARKAEEALRPVVEVAHRVAETLDDKTASGAVELYPGMRYDGSLIEHGARINWQGSLRRAAADLWDTRENNPERAPALWEEIAYQNGVRVIPDTITAGLAFGKDELGWWSADGLVYRSLTEGNVFTPGQHAAGWCVAEE